MKLLASLLALCLMGASASAQETVFLIRHAEKEVGISDPELTPEGRRRAHGWAVMLGKAGVDVVITSEFRRTCETGGLIATDLGIDRKELPADDVTGLVDLLGTEHADDTVLIVGHSDTVPQVIAAMGVSDTVEIAEKDFANLFVVVPQGSAAPLLIRQKMP